MDKLMSMMFDLYGVCIRQESDCTNYFKIRQFKRFLIGDGRYACSEVEFHRLLDAFRALAREQPEVLFIEEGVSFSDPDDKKIGWHDFLRKLYLPDSELAVLFRRALASTREQP
jgi:hypothetical protein